jgi:hypothetical protein
MFMSETTEVRQPSGQPSGGQYAERTREESEAILNSPLIQLGEGSDWKNGGLGRGVSIIESPISDRERNYFLCFESRVNRHSSIYVSPVEFGIEHPELGQGNDDDRIYIGTEDCRGMDTLDVQYLAAVDVSRYADQIMELEDEGKLSEFETEILIALRAETGDPNTDVRFFDDGITWSRVTVIHNHKIVDELPIHSINPDGSIEVTTSNLMSSLEDSPVYQKIVHDRIGDSVLHRLISARFPNDQSNEEE